MPRVKAVIAEIGTSGHYETLSLTKDPKEAISEAVEIEHGCDDQHCDIRAALENGYAYSAAYLLQGATETPLLDAVLNAYKLNLHTFDDCSDWSDWVTWHTENGIECESCGSFNYPDESGNLDDWCGNCHAPITKEE